LVTVKAVTGASGKASLDNVHFTYKTHKKEFNAACLLVGPIPPPTTLTGRLGAPLWCRRYVL
jgi:hypothetical protein